MTRNWKKLSEQLKQEMEKRERVVLATKVPRKYRGFAKSGAFAFTLNNGTIYVLTNEVKKHGEDREKVLAHELSHRVLKHKQEDEEGALKKVSTAKRLKTAPIALQHEVEANLLLYKTYGHPSAGDFAGEVGGWFRDWHEIGNLAPGELLAIVKSEILDRLDIPKEWKGRVNDRIDRLTRKLADRTGHSLRYVRKILMYGRTPPKEEFGELVKYVWYGMPIMDISQTPKGRVASHKRPRVQTKKRQHKTPPPSLQSTR